MLAETAISYILTASISFADGSRMDAYGDNYPTAEACYMQGEAELKIMAREVESIETDLPKKVVKEIRVSCDPVGGSSDALLFPAWEARYVR